MTDSLLLPFLRLRLVARTGGAMQSRPRGDALGSEPSAPQLPPDAPARAEEAQAAADAREVENVDVCDAGESSPEDDRPLHRSSRSRRSMAYYRQQRYFDSTAMFVTRAYKLSEVSPGTKLNVERLFEEYVWVKGKPNGQLQNSCSEGLEAPHGWLVIAMAVGSYNTVLPCELVGAMVVEGKEGPRNWGAATSTRRRATVRVLGVHHMFLKNGVPEALWNTLTAAIRDDPEVNQLTLELVVTGGSCLNNQTTRKLYTSWGFQGVANTLENQSISGAWSATFVNGEPPPRPE